MVEIEDKLISEDLFDNYFCCDLKECKGMCCIEGDSGAPLEECEIALIEDNIEVIKRFMTKEGIEAIDSNGVCTIDSDGDLTTTLIGGCECAFVFREKGIALCAIEKAHRESLIDNVKPISCHLYPIRVKHLGGGMQGLNYHRWAVCEGAVRLGEQRKCKVYEGVKDAIIRKYGEEFYTHLTEVDKILELGDFDYE